LALSVVQVRSGDKARHFLSSIPRIIARYQWGVPYSHTAILVNPESPNPKCWEATSAGVTYNGWYDCRPAGTPYHVYSYPCTVHQRERAFRFLDRQIGKPYDYWGLFAFLWRSSKYQDPKKWFCSELAAAAFQVSGISAFNWNVIKPHQITPRLLAAVGTREYSMEPKGVGNA